MLKQFEKYATNSSSLYSFIQDDEYEKYREILNFYKVKKEVIPFLKTAFGDLFVYYENNVYWFESQFNTTTLCDDVEGFFGKFLIDEGIRKNILHEELFYECEKAFGKLQSDECYAPVLSFAIGGSLELSQIKIQKTLDILEMLSGVATGEE